jgi:predicted Ser/Thr protein kinase
MKGRPGAGQPPGSAAEGPLTVAGPFKLLGRGYQGAVYLVESPRGPLIVKKAMGRGLARVARRGMLRREHAVYQLLRGVPGVPRCHGLNEGDELVLEYIDGRSLREVKQSFPGREQFFATLLELIQAIHRAGVAHGDLKRKDNILLGRDGRPYLIDFGTAMSAPQGAGIVRRVLFRQIRRMDLNAWVKLKYQRQWVEIARADLDYFNPTLPERMARVVRRAWRAMTLRRRRKARQASRR